MLRSDGKLLLVSGQLADARLLQRVQGSGFSGRAAAYIKAVMADTPKAFWPMQEESGLPSDISGNSLPFTSKKRQPVYRRPGPFGSDYSIHMAANTGLIRSTPVSTATNNISHEFWIYIEELGGSSTNSVFLNGNGSTGFGADLLTSGKFQGFCEGVAGLSQSTTAMSAGSWYHWVFVRDAGTWVYYVNGAVDVANAGTNTPNVPSGTTKVGNPSNNDTSIYRIAYVAFYESALSSTQVANHYNATA